MQINANRIIQQQIDDQKKEETLNKNFDHQMERYRHLKECIDGFKHKIEKNKLYPNLSYSDDIYVEKFGAEAINQFFKDRYSDSSKVSELKTVISFFYLILNNVVSDKTDTDSKFLFNLIEIQFYRKLWDLNEAFIQSALKNSTGMHSDIILIVEKINEIHIELIKYKDIWPN